LFVFCISKVSAWHFQYNKRFIEPKDT
jgi:hypothetical protein